MGQWERALRLEILEMYAETGNDSLLQELHQVSSLEDFSTDKEDL